MRIESNGRPILKDMVAFSARAPLGSDIHKEIKKTVENIVGIDGFFYIVNRRELPEGGVMATYFAFQGIEFTNDKIEP